jgi:hypothetical protein
MEGLGFKEEISSVNWQIDWFYINNSAGESGGAIELSRKIINTKNLN